LPELRRQMSVGAIALDQRKPVEVALLVRDAARAADDYDALREAYESLARAPSRIKDQAALRKLLAELNAEDGPTEAERRAIRIPILLTAFKSAADADLVLLAAEAEKDIRACLRADPPNLESAISLEPILEKAQDRSDEALRSSLQNTLRELQSHGSIRTLPKAPGTIPVTYEELLRAVDGQSTNVEIVDAAYESARRWGKDGVEYLPALRNALLAVVAVADRYALGEFGKDGAVGAFKDVDQKLVPNESDTALSHLKTREFHRVRNRRGQPITLGPHLTFGGGYRLYLAFDEHRRRIYVGHIGDHLPGKKSKVRPR
jgi:hypothetical protein